MDRRSFLRALLTGAAGAIAAHELDLDRLLWVPGERTFFLPSPSPDLNTSLLTTDIITREALRILERNLTFANCVNRSYDARSYQTGTTLTIRKPARYAA